MLDHVPFLATIAEHPADDGPRLVYADWLEEQGESDRAEFIRLQIQLAADDDDSVERWRAERRAVALFDRYWRDWLRPVCAALTSPVPPPDPPRSGPVGRLWRRLLGGAPGDKVARALTRSQAEPFAVDGPVRLGDSWTRLTRVEFRRGFPDHLVLSLGGFDPDLPGKLAVLADVHPLDRLSVLWENDDMDWGRLDGPHFRRLPALRLEVPYGGLGGSDEYFIRQMIQAVARSPHLEALERLELTPQRFLDRESAALLVGATGLPRLRLLRVSLDESGLTELAGSPLAERVDLVLHFVLDPGNVSTLGRLVAGLRVLRLRELDLPMLVPPDEALAGSDGVSPLDPPLHRLRVWRALAFEAGRTFLTALIAAVRPREFELDAIHYAHGVDGSGVRIPMGVLAAATLPTVYRAAFPRMLLDDGDAQHIADAVPEALVALNLSENAIGDGGAMALARAEWIGRLRRLNLANNLIGNRGALALAAVAGWENLVELNLENNRIGRRGRAALRQRLGERCRL